MQLGDEVSQRQVYEEWALTNEENKLQGLSGQEYDRAMERALTDHKAPIKAGLPKDILWRRATIEAGDEKNLFIISEGGWVEEFGQDTNIISVANLVGGKDGGHCGQIEDMKEHLDSGLPLKEVFVMIATQETGPFTIIDGDHRLIAYYLTLGLAGLDGYVGFSPYARKPFCTWTLLTPLIIPI
jgi:hypothetical protein